MSGWISKCRSLIFLLSHNICFQISRFWETYYSTLGLILFLVLASRESNSVRGKVTNPNHCQLRNLSSLAHNKNIDFLFELPFLKSKLEFLQTRVNKTDWWFVIVRSKFFFLMPNKIYTALIFKSKRYEIWIF